MAADGIKLCYDRVVPEDYAPARTRLERALASPSPASGSGTIDASKPLPPPKISLVTLKKWPNGSTLKCRFLDGSTKQKKRVEGKARLWEEHANIDFKFVKSGPAEIRISFGADEGSWSALGTDALIERYFPHYQPTMNYGWLEDDTEDAEYERVVVHEFGHALGAIHEHQSPKATLKWNTAEVYRVFSGPPNFWDKATIDHNILNKYSVTQTNSSKFDPASIMLYAFPGRLFENGKGTNANDELSATDKSFIAGEYPR